MRNLSAKLLKNRVLVSFSPRLYFSGLKIPLCNVYANGNSHGERMT